MKTQLLSMCLSLLFTWNIYAYGQDVLDSEGNKLQEGSKYYVVSAIIGSGGGLSVSTKWGRRDCPTTIAREAEGSNYGIPVTFHPAVSRNNGTIQLSQSLNIKFEMPIPTCAKTTVWQVGASDPVLRQELLTIDGDEGNPGCYARPSWFKIETGSVIRNCYKFVWNPNDICPDLVFQPKEVVISDMYGAGALVMTIFPDPYPFLDVRFVKYVPPSVIRNKAAAAAAA